jgi:hypothetical protein
MEIEIITTKKKLTKGLIAQMKRASLSHIKNGESLGYVINCVKGSYKTVLIKYLSDYYILETSWEKGTLSVYRKVGKWSQSIKFDSESDCDEWWGAFQPAIKTVTHIYI